MDGLFKSPYCLALGALLDLLFVVGCEADVFLAISGVRKSRWVDLGREIKKPSIK